MLREYFQQFGAVADAEVSFFYLNPSTHLCRALLVCSKMSKDSKLFSKLAYDPEKSKTNAPSFLIIPLKIILHRSRVIMTQGLTILGASLSNRY